VSDESITCDSTFEERRKQDGRKSASGLRQRVHPDATTSPNLLEKTLRAEPPTQSAILSNADLIIMRQRKHRMKLMTWIACLWWTGLSTLVQADGDATAGKALFAPCMACHGQNAEGNPALNAPLLAGQEDWYLYRQLNHFKTGIRGADERDIFGLQMRPMAMLLATDQAIGDVVAYLNTLTPVPAHATLNGDPQKGRALYRLCATCHGQNAEGNPAYQAPRLSHQHDWYLLTQLKHFKAGIRGKAPNDTFGRQMQAVTMTLMDEHAMKHVIAYIKTLGQ